MEIHLFLKGLVLGFSIAAPVGPIGVLCIKRTLQFGRFSGFFSGLGAAAADTAYGAIAAFGLTAISSFLMGWQFWLRTVGGIFLLYLGFRTFFSDPHRNQKRVSHASLLGDFVSTFFLTFTSPMTILSYLAVFTGLGFIDSAQDYSGAILGILGVFVGSTFWWLILSEVVTFFRKKLSEEIMRWINRLAGLLIIALGIISIFI